VIPPDRISQKLVFNHIRPQGRLDENRLGAYNKLRLDNATDTTSGTLQRAELRKTLAALNRRINQMDGRHRNLEYGC